MHGEFLLSVYSMNSFSKISLRNKEWTLMAKQYAYTGYWLKRWVEKNWLLVPIILIGVVAVAILEATLLYRTVPVPTLQVQQIANIPLTGSANRFDYPYMDSHSRLL